MAVITQRTAQDIVIARAARAGAVQAQRDAEINQLVAATGLPGGVATLNGRYDEDGEFSPYLRLDVDAFDSGRGCAP